MMKLLTAYRDSPWSQARAKLPKVRSAGLRFHQPARVCDSGRVAVATRAEHRHQPHHGQDGDRPVEQEGHPAAAPDRGHRDLPASSVFRYGQDPATSTADMSTAIAVAWPPWGVSRKANACCHSSRASTMVSWAGPPPVIT